MNAKEKQFLTEKFNDYQNGQLSEPEKKIIDGWFDSRMEDASQASDPINLKTVRLQEELFTNIRRGIRHDQPNEGWRKRQWIKVACMLLMLSGLSFFVLRPPKILRDGQENHTGTQTTWQSYKTAKGEVKKITLPDGTKIWMNAGTEIRLSSDFGTSGFRKLKLDYGEAFFRVKRDTLRPFSIATQDFVTTVLGTSFNIKSYPELKTYKVAVASGKVKVDYRKNGKQITLSNGLVKDQVLTFNHKTNKAAVTHQNVMYLSQWKTNRALYFENLTLAQIGAELSRQYNIEVHISGRPDTEQTYTLQLQHQDLQMMLRQLVLKTGISYQLSNTVLTLNPGI